MTEQKSKGIPLGERWDMDENSADKGGTLFKFIKPGRGFKPKSKQAAHIAKSHLSDKTNELLSKLKGKR